MKERVTVYRKHGYAVMIVKIGRKRTKPIRRHGFKKAKEGITEVGQTKL